ncbi:MAG: sulfatase [Deltaproteobacteria bacterium]|nr:sulfatase [Deltaproteobacteria bacterium]
MALWGGTAGFVAAFVAALMLILPACSSESAAPPERIILILIDTLRRDHLSCYGGKAPTPNLDALAGRGQIFSNAYSAFHWTTPSMSALFTGHTPSLDSTDGMKAILWNRDTWCGLARFFKPDPGERCLPRSLPTLAGTMRDAGYWTAGVTSNLLLFKPAGYARGFDAWREVGGHWGSGKGELAEDAPDWTLRTGERVNEEVSDVLGSRPGDRFFLYVHFMDTHDYMLAGIPYAEGVAKADAAVGDLMKRLEELGLLEGSVVIVTADHGEKLGETHVVPGMPNHGGNPSFEELLQVPLIVSPARFADESKILRTDDVFRMLIEMAGAPPPRKSDLAPGELYVSEWTFRTYRKGRWKSFQSRQQPKAILVDLESDPGEITDLADRHPDVLEAHRKRTDELAASFAAKNVSKVGMSPQDRERLKALGYLQ